jgi:hypothetical protein
VSSSGISQDLDFVGKTPSQWNSPVVPLLVALPIATAFVVLRWLHAAHRQLGHFVVAGSRYASPGRVPKDLPVGQGSGYDGQFYYRLALDPFDLKHTAFGISFDSFSRVERIGYPFLAWLVALGRHGSIPLALVIVNVAACGAVAFAGGLLAQSARRHALWGLAFAGYWGYLWTLGRDLTELTAAAFVLLGLAAWARRAPVWAGIALLCAVLSKETSVLLVGALAVAALWVGVGRGRPESIFAVRTSPSTVRHGLIPRRSDLAFLIPIGGFVLWQVILLHATGSLPIYKSGGENLGVPLVGLFHGITHYVSLFPSAASAVWLGELAILVLVVVGAAMSLGAVPIEFRFLWFVSVLLALSAATGIWLGDVGFRSLDDAYLMSWLVLLYRRQAIWPWAVICLGTWAAVCVELVRYI